MFRNAVEFINCLSSKTPLDSLTLSKARNYIELHEDAAITAVDADKDTALILAIRNRHTAIAEQLLTIKNLNVNAKNNHGTTALLEATHDENNTSIVEKLLAFNDIDVNCKNDKNRRPLFVTVERGYIGIFKILLADQRIDPNLAGEHGYTPLTEAACHSHKKEIVSMLLDDDRVDTTAVNDNKNGHNALMTAAIYSNTDMIDLLLTHPKSKININAQSKNGYTALISVTAKNKNENVTRLLSIEGIEVNIQTNEGYTVFMWAAWNGNLETLNTLLNRNDIKVNIQTKTGETALIYSVMKGHTHIVKRLLEVKGLDVNAKGENGRTALIEAVKRGHDKIIDMLAPHANINDVDNDDDTALHHAVREGESKTVKKLLSINDINVTTENKINRTPLGIAAHNIFDEEYPDYHRWLNIAALILLKIKNGNEISEYVLNILKEYKETLFEKLTENGNEQDVLNQIFENNDSALHRVFFYKNSTIHKGRLNKLYEQYLKLPGKEKKNADEKSAPNIAPKTNATDEPVLAARVKNLLAGAFFKELSTFLLKTNTNGLTDDILNAIKPHKENLYAAMKKNLPENELRTAIKDTFEGKNTTVFGKIFWRGNTALNRGNLQTVHEAYQTIIISMLLDMSNRALQENDIKSILNFVNGDGLFTLTDEKLIAPLHTWFDVVPHDSINASGVAYLKQYKLIVETTVVNPFANLVGFGSSVFGAFRSTVSNISILNNNSANVENPTKVADLHGKL